MASTVERTLVLVKPDGVVRGLVGEVLSRIERKGLKIIGLKMLSLSRELAEKLYSVHNGKPFFERLVVHMTSGPIVAVVVEGRWAVTAVRTLIGETASCKSYPGSIRGDFALDVTMNVVHASDSLESAEREIPLLFGGDELFSYLRSDERWI